MLIFNDAQTLAYSTNFNYVGEAFNYNNSARISIKGRLQSDRNSDGGADYYFGMAYVESESGEGADGNVIFNGIPIVYNGEGVSYNYEGVGSGASGWVPAGGSELLITGSTQEIYGQLFFEGGYAFVRALDSGAVISSGDLVGNYSPLYDIWEGMDSVMDAVSDFQEIYLNGVSIGSGRIISINFPKSENPRVSTYETEIQLYKEGNLYNLSGEGFDTIDINSDFCKYVSNLDEGFSLTTSRDGTLSYDRSFGFDCIDANFSGNAFLDQVKAFASGIIYNDPVFQGTLSSYPDFYQEEGSRMFSESYDPVNGSFSFSEKFIGPTSGQNYKWTNNLSVSLANEGSSTISEKGSIVGVRRDYLESAYEGLLNAQDSSLGRVLEFYANYVGGSGICSSGLFLTTINKSVNSDAGIIDYSFEYSNDPLSRNGFTVNRELQYSKSEDGRSTISENGSVNNTENGTGAERLTDSINYFKTNISGGIDSRVYALYTGNASGCGCTGVVSVNDLKKIDTETTYSEYNGLFSYNYVYRDDCTSLYNGFYFVTKEKNTSKSVHDVFVGVTPYDGEIAQLQNKSALVEERQTITVLCTSTGKVIENYVTAAIAHIEKPGGVLGPGYYMSSADYNFEPDNSKLVMNIGYNYTGYKAYSDYNV